MSIISLIDASGVLRAMNIRTIQDLTVGFMSPEDLIPKPVLDFNGIGTKRIDGSQITARFTPVLHAYITSDCQEAAIIRAAIDTSTIWPGLPRARLGPLNATQPLDIAPSF
ncbi:uncharacterized protein EDB93DRAFT_1245612 [Suillus bovinus]|uniref:uncharacterized protein n=1 Tax=Suillus bovinus TaxID=48563 RepID=UPI001B8812F4|nr:uncharacterized protein EDB93DRAFT_1245612 [Suillus bovinus]KAG2159055.1 hypothetical protein EDB93DRAFT_1245612 [Suillus bovinus]